jgi:hypothetical protein
MIDKLTRQLEKMRKKEKILDQIIPIVTLIALWNGNKGLPDKQQAKLYGLVQEYYDVLTEESQK